MRFVDEPESPSFSPDGSTIAFSALTRRHQRHLHRRPGDRQAREPDERRFRRLRPDLLARRQVPDLHGAHQRQPEAVQVRSRHQEEDADHVRHARRGRGAVRRCEHHRVLVDGDRSDGAARAGRRAQRQHLQHLDARPDDRRAEAVHRRARRQPVAGRPERGRQQADRVRQLLQGRLRHPHARSQGAAAHGRVGRLRERPARSSTSRRRSATRSSPRTTGRRSASRRCSSRGGRR